MWITALVTNPAGDGNDESILNPANACYRGLRARGVRFETIDAAPSASGNAGSGPTLTRLRCPD